MNISKRLRTITGLLYSSFLKFRTLLPKQKCKTFASNISGIGSIIVINLDRQPKRWGNVQNELQNILDAHGNPLSEMLIRHSACDAQNVLQELMGDDNVKPFYTLADQLFVEPQPLAMPDAFDLNRPIKMSTAEVAVARSHIDVWKVVANSDTPFTLILEDDVWFERGFSQLVDRAWHEMEATDGTSPAFDVMYLSYKEVRHGAPKSFLSNSVFRPERGLWYMSGYVLSKKGAQKLLALLPCSGPIDLWANLKFKAIDVRALRRSVIRQRMDLVSTNSYSILPTLSQIGVLDGGEASLFQRKPTHKPVFAFGIQDSGLSSLAMALSMLGYRCCSDFDQIPESEFKKLVAGKSDRIFNAYVNIGSLKPQVNLLMKQYPHAKFIVIGDLTATISQENEELLGILKHADNVHLLGDDSINWRGLCEHLKLAPPTMPYPAIPDIGLRPYICSPYASSTNRSTKHHRHDASPWIIESRTGWKGISSSPLEQPNSVPTSRVHFKDDFTDIQCSRWLLRNDTFPGNLGLFRRNNILLQSGGGLSLSVFKESLGVRNFSAAAISSQHKFLFGRFEATLQATDVPGLVTGFFLHRDSPRQEIDVEIAGHRPNLLLVNVFYNPGDEGAKFDYGYRGTPMSVPLGFDASKALHHYAIEWDPCEIRWFVDGTIVHRRPIWNPTPIPHLPMTLHVNTWPTRSRELAGNLAIHALPASAVLGTLAVDAFILKDDKCWSNSTY